MERQNSKADEVEQVIKSLRQSKLIEPPSTWNGRNRRWWNACTSCSLHEMTQLLVEDSTLIRWKNPLDGWTAMHYVAKNGNLRCLDLLVKQYQADVNVQSKNGSTPLHIAVMFSQRLFVRQLVEVYHAQTDIMDYCGRFPLNLITPEMTGDLKTLLSSGRLARIREAVSALEPKRNSLQLSKHALISAAEGTLNRIYNMASSRPTFVNVNPSTRILLSTLTDGGGGGGYGDKDVGTIFRCLHHGQTVSVPEPAAEPQNQKSSFLDFDTMSKKSALPPTQPAHRFKHGSLSGRTSEDTSSSSAPKKGHHSDTRRLSHAFSLHIRRRNCSPSAAGDESTASSAEGPSGKENMFRVPSTSLFTLPRKRRAAHTESDVSSVDRQRHPHHQLSLPRKISDALATRRGSGKENRMKSNSVAKVERYSFAGFPQANTHDEKLGINSSTASVSRNSSSSLKSSSIDSAMYPSMSSSLGLQRSPSISSLTECTEALLDRFLPTSTVNQSVQ